MTAHDVASDGRLTLVIPHPIGGTAPDLLHAWGEQAVDELITQFGRVV